MEGAFVTVDVELLSLREGGFILHLKIRSLPPHINLTWVGLGKTSSHMIAQMVTHSDTNQIQCCSTSVIYLELWAFSEVNNNFLQTSRPNCLLCNPFLFLTYIFTRCYWFILKAMCTLSFKHSAEKLWPQWALNPKPLVNRPIVLDHQIDTKSLR